MPHAADVPRVCLHPYSPNCTQSITDRNIHLLRIIHKSSIEQWYIHDSDSTVRTKESQDSCKLTSFRTGGQLVELSERMCDICVPMTRWILQHSLHSNTPLLMEAQEGSKEMDKIT